MGERELYWLFALSVVIGLAASIEDLWHRKVSNWIALAALVSGIIVHSSFEGAGGLWEAVLGSLIGFGVFVIFFLLGGMGGGDIKLMAGFGAILGSKLIVIAAMMTAIVGAVMALGYLLYRKIRRAGAPQGTLATPARKESIPYAPAITLGVLLSFLSHESFAYLSDKAH